MEDENVYTFIDKRQQEELNNASIQNLKTFHEFRESFNLFMDNNEKILKGRVKNADDAMSYIHVLSTMQEIADFLANDLAINANRRSAAWYKECKERENKSD